MSGTAAAAVVEAGERRALWRGHGAAPRVLAGLWCRLGLTKGQGWQSAEPEELLLHLASPLAEPLRLPSFRSRRGRAGGRRAGRAALLSNLRAPAGWR